MRGEEKSWHSCGSERKEQRVEEEEEAGTGDKKGSLKRERKKRKVRM